MMTPPAVSARSTAQRLAAVLPTVAALVLLVFAARWFAARWESVVGDAGRPPIAWGWLVLAAALLVVHVGTAIAIWQQVLTAVGARIGWAQATDSLVPSLLARYVPGKIWANAARLALARRAGVAVGTSAGAVLWEMLVLIACAGFTAYAGLALAAGTAGLDPAWERTAALLVVASALALAVLVVVARNARGETRLARLAGSRPARMPSLLLPVAVTNMVSWACYGAAHVAIAASLVPLAPGEMPLVVGAVALAWTGGYLAFIMPVGLGVRDGLLLAMVGTLFTPAQGLAFVALSRVVQLAVDGLVTAAWLLSATSRSRLGRPAGSPSA